MQRPLWNWSETGPAETACGVPDLPTGCYDSLCDDAPSGTRRAPGRKREPSHVDVVLHRPQLNLVRQTNITKPAAHFLDGMLSLIRFERDREMNAQVQPAC